MGSNTATGAGYAMRSMTVPEMRQRLYPIRGGIRKNVEGEGVGDDIRNKGLSGAYAERQGL
ncbi:MAG: hypothetical protein IJS80_07720 [Lachnospiraceae bacterium]|nr:hypothetical protein [Lachnospiraceae bacterium]